MSNHDQQILQQLQSAVAGRLFMSESDYPFELVEWDGPPELTADFVRTVTDEPADANVEELELEQLLHQEQYDRLVQVFRSQLANSKAYKVGRINMPVYIVGRSSSGRWLGVMTRIVQT